MSKGYTSAQVNAWHRDGIVLFPEFFTAAEIAPIRQDYERLYGTTGIGNGEALSVPTPDPIGAFHRKQFANIHDLPYDASVEMNLLSLHPRLIDLAADLLGCEQVHLYQSHTWAKFTGDADYDQPFHCDYGNHTLTVPADDVSLRTVNFVIYISAVTDALGAMHYVTREDAEAVLGQGAVNAGPHHQEALRQCQRSGAAPAGSLVAYCIDTFHRGTNMTEPGGHRYTLTVSYKRADNANIGFHVWQHAEHRPWHLVINHASPKQLGCLGIPLPGDPFWTPRTLALCQARWPDWDLQPYRQGLELEAT
jgi:hypothetical protein